MLSANNKLNPNELSDVIKNQFMSGHPLFEKLNFSAQIISEGVAHLRAPFSQRFADNKGALHRGALSILADTACGMATFSALGTFVPIATIDIRIDYRGLITPGADLEARIICDFVGSKSAHTRGEIVSIQKDEHSEVQEIVVAQVSSVFAVNTPGRSFDEGLEGMKR